jgi:hypothetical protein
MKLIFGTICRNIESQFNTLYTFLQNIIDVFPEAHICIYENNSTDSTATLLNKCKEISANIQIVSEFISKEVLLTKCEARTWDNTPCRMEIIAFARNKLLDMINSVTYEDEDRIILFDADMYKPIDIQQIKERLSINADAIFANGVKQSGGNYYDMYALRSSRLTPIGPEILGDSFWKSMRSIAITEITPVFSAFGGLCIYKGSSVRDNAYSGTPTSDFHELNKRIVKQLQITLPPVNTHIVGALQGVYLFDRDIFYVNNSGYNFPVICEHSTFHARMYMRGQTKMYIDPALIYYSTH